MTCVLADHCHGRRVRTVFRLSRMFTDFHCSILVLKDGQIVEQGSHSELLEQNGIFATMWADQISTEDPSASQSIKQEVPGYSVEPSAPEEPSAKETTTEAVEAPVIESEAAEVVADKVVPKEEHESSGTEAAQPEVDAAKPAADTAAGLDEPVGPETVEELAAAAPETEAEAETMTHDAVSPEVATETPKVASSDPIAAEVPADDAPVAFPSEGPVAFPGYQDSTEQLATSPPQNTTPVVSPGVTFDESVQFPARSGTPDQASDPKRKRTASQNFQRFARRVSLVGKKSGSSSSIPIPSPSKKDDLPRTSNEGSLRGEGSPAASIQGDEGKKSKKDKKLMKRLSLK